MGNFENYQTEKTVIENFAKSFYNASKIHIGIHDVHYTTVISGGEDGKNICYYCKNNCPNFYSECLCEDMTRIEHIKKMKAPTVHRCHLGLTEAIIPILVEERVAGIIFLGQVRIVPDMSASYESIFSLLTSKYPKYFSLENEKEIKMAYDNTVSMTKDVFNSYVDLASVMANSIYVKHWVDTRIVTSKMIFQRYLDKMDVIRMPLSDFSTKQVAAELNMSYSQLNRLSVSVVGMPLKQYILHEKIKAAANILKTKPSISVKTVANEVRIEDSHYFSRLFRRYMGCSCSEYKSKKNTGLKDSI